MEGVSNLYVDAAYSSATHKAGWAASLAYKKDGVEKRRVFYSSLIPPYRTHNCAETLAAMYAIYIILSSGIPLTRLNVHLDSFYAMRFLYKHYRNFLYFPDNLLFSETFIKNPSLTFFPIEEHYENFIRQLQNKFVDKRIDIGIFHVKAHVEKQPKKPRNRHQENNNKTDFYARIAKEAAEHGTPIRMSIVNDGDHVLKQG